MKKHTQLLSRIRAYIRRHGTNPTQFGKDVLKDPNFVFDLENGRKLRESTEQKVIKFIEAQTQKSLERVR